MSLTTTFTITRKRGDTRPLAFTLKSDGVAVDITGHTIVLTVDPAEDPADDTNNVMQLTATITDGAAGEFEFRPAAVDVDFVGEYYFDIQWTDSNSYVGTIGEGPWIMDQDITK